MEQSNVLKLIFLNSLGGYLIGFLINFVIVLFALIKFLVKYPFRKLDINGFLSETLSKRGGNRGVFLFALIPMFLIEQVSSFLFTFGEFRIISVISIVFGFALSRFTKVNSIKPLLNIILFPVIILGGLTRSIYLAFLGSKNIDN